METPGKLIKYHQLRRPENRASLTGLSRSSMDRHQPESWTPISRNVGPTCGGVVARLAPEFAGFCPSLQYENFVFKANRLAAYVMILYKCRCSKALNTDTNNRLRRQFRLSLCLNKPTTVMAVQIYVQSLAPKKKVYSAGLLDNSLKD